MWSRKGCWMLHHHHVMVIPKEGICLQHWKSASKPCSCSAGELSGAGREKSPFRKQHPAAAGGGRFTKRCEETFLPAFEPLLLPRSRSGLVASSICCTWRSSFFASLI